MGNVVRIVHSFKSFPIFMAEKTKKVTLKNMHYLKNYIVSSRNLPQRLQIKRQQTLTFYQACLIKGCNMCERNEPSLKHTTVLFKDSRSKIILIYISSEKGLFELFISFSHTYLFFRLYWHVDTLTQILIDLAGPEFHFFSTLQKLSSSSVQF